EREGGRAVRDGTAAACLLDQRRRGLHVAGQLLARLPEHALVREPVAGGLVAPRRDLLRELRIAADGHAEEEEGCLGSELVEQVEYGRRLPFERRFACVPTGRAGGPVDELVPVLEVDAEEQRRLLRKHGGNSSGRAVPSARGS